MKTSKILITSLLAAAAMGVPAWANNYADKTVSSDENATYTKNSYTENVVSGNTIINENCTWTWGNGVNDDGTTTGDSGSGHGLIKQEGTLSGAGKWLFTRTQTTGANFGRFLQLAGDNSEFTGTFQLTSSANYETKGPNVVLLLGSLDAATNATVDLGQCTGVAFAAGVTSANVGGFVGTSASSWILAKSFTPKGGTQTTNLDGSDWNADATVQTINLTGSGEYAFAGRVGNAIPQNGTEADVQNPYTLNINKTGTGKQTFSGLVALKNLSVSGGELIFSGTSATSKGTASVAGTLTTSGSGVVKVLEYGVLDLSGATVSLANAIQNSGQVTLSTGTVFEVSTFGQTVSLISGAGTISGVEWNALTNKNFTYNGVVLGRSTVDVSSAGSVNISYVEAKTLTWNGSASDTWSEAVVGTESSSKPWKDESDADDAFYAGDSVVFSKDETTTVTVADSGVNANTVTISAGTVSFTGGTITATGGVSVTGGTLNLSTNVFAAGTAFNVSGGTLTLGSAFALTAGTSIDVSDAGTVSGTITSMAAGSSLTLAGSGTMTATISSMAAGSSLNLAGTGAASSVTLGVSGSGGSDRQISGDLTIGNATVTTARNDIFNYDTTVDRTLRLNSGGELAIGSTRQSFDTNWKITLNGGKISGTGDDNGYALDFFESNTVTVTDDSEISANLCMRGGNAKTLAFEVNADKTLTISGNIVTPASSAGSNSVLVKQGKGTLVLSGDNTYNQGTRIEEGTVEVRHANGLGTNTVNVTGNAKLALGEGLGISNNISIADSVKLTLGGGYSVALNGAITGSGTLRADMLWQTVALGGDNSGFSGAVEVVGSTVDAAHASALGTGMVKISSAVSTVGETTVPVSGSIQASTANVELHDVAIGLVETDSAALRTSSSGSFTVASGVTLYLDVSLLNKTSWSDEVALMITAQNAITDGTFFNEVLVGTFDSDDNWINDTEWAYKADSWDASTGTLYLISVPEPSAFGLLAGAGALALVAARRRRTKKA